MPQQNSPVKSKSLDFCYDCHKIGGMTAIDVPPSDRLISISKLMKRWDMCRESIKRYIRRGKIHPLKLNSRCVRVRMSEVLEIEKALTDKAYNRN